MMQYRAVKNAIAKLLFNNSLDRFTVIGHQLQNKSAKEAKDNIVQVYYTDGNFPESRYRPRGPKSHDINISIDLTTSAAATGDLSVLNSETATAQQKAVAIAAIKDATQVADDKIDDLIEWVFAILTNTLNFDLGLTPGTIASQRIGRIQKDTLLEHGGLVVKTAMIQYTCRVSEDITGDIGNKPDPAVIDQTIQYQNPDTTTATKDTPVGIIVENENT